MVKKILDRIARELMPLCPEEIHVWSSALSLDRQSVSDWSAILSSDERCRAARFRFERDREQFVAARSLLRCLVGSYLRLEPARVQFVYSPFGKPLLHPNVDSQGLCFNLSHSHREALFAFTHHRGIGVDVEYIPADWDGASLAEQVLSSAENEQFRKLANSERKHAFFRCWTRKEAYIKARGEGLSVPLDQFEVSLLSAEPAPLAEWRIQDVTVPSGYAGALAAEGYDWNTRQFRIFEAATDQGVCDPGPSPKCS